MQWSVRRARKRASVFVVVLGIGVTAGFLAFDSAEQAQTQDLSPAEIIDSRFPPGWDAAPTPAARPLPTLAPATIRAASAAPPPPPAPIAPRAAAAAAPPAPVRPAAAAPAPAGDAEMALAARLLFSPNPTYPPAIAATGNARAPWPEQALAYADPAGETAPAAASVERNAAVPRPPERRVPPARAVPESNTVFNDAQIASIKERLALTQEQQRYWPAVASALRAITRQRAQTVAGKTVASATAARAAFVDPNSAEVARLKSAAIPLIMTMREEQKREVRMLAHLMGLESVAAQF
jgi:hypothetical protein